MTHSNTNTSVILGSLLKEENLNNGQHLPTHSNGSMPMQMAGDISKEVADLILFGMVFVASPMISILGIIGNCFSIIILRRHGLKKCSNILLFSLAISDISYLTGFNSIGWINYSSPEVRLFAMSYRPAYVMYVLYNICDVMDWAGGVVSFNIPVLITIERLVAVFLPMKFHVIITPKRTVFVVGCLYVFWYSLLVYTRLWFEFDYKHSDVYNMSVGHVARSTLYYRQQELSNAFQSMLVYLCTIVPLPIVMVGCVCIGIRVKLASIKRRKMTSSQQGEELKRVSAASKTTRTLISVCAVYSVASFVTLIPHHLPQYMTYTLFSDFSNNISKVVFQLMNLVITINSSCNFIIYVVTNKKFRDTQKEILSKCFRRSKS